MSKLGQTTSTTSHDTRESSTAEVSTSTLPDWCLCPVTQDVMTDPIIVAANCNHTVDRSSYDEWIKTGGNTTCPSCGTALYSLSVSPNVPLRGAIEDAIQSGQIPPQFALKATATANIEEGSGREAQASNVPPKRILRPCGNTKIDKCVSELFDSSDPEVVEACYLTLDTLGRGNNPNKISILQAGGIDAVVLSMRRHKDSKVVQQVACQALHMLAVNHDASTAAVGAAGGIEAIVSAMRRHEGDASVQEKACGAIYALTSKYRSNNNNNYLFKQVGGIDAMVTAMMRHQSVKDVQVQALWAFFGLAQEYQDSIREAGGINAVVLAMKRHESVPEVQWPSCEVLLDLAKNNVDNQDAIRSCGGISAIETAMKVHKDNLTVQRYGRQAYSWVKNGRPIGTIYKWLQTVDEEADTQQVVVALEDMDTSRYDSPEYKKMVREANGIATIVKCMKRLESAAEVQEKACSALANLTFEVPENQSLLLEANGLEAIFGAILVVICCENFAKVAVPSVDKPY